MFKNFKIGKETKDRFTFFLVAAANIVGTLFAMFLVCLVKQALLPHGSVMETEGGKVFEIAPVGTWNVIFQSLRFMFENFLITFFISLILYFALAMINERFLDPVRGWVYHRLYCLFSDTLVHFVNPKVRYRVMEKLLKMDCDRFSWKGPSIASMVLGVCLIWLPLATFLCANMPRDFYISRIVLYPGIVELQGVDLFQIKVITLKKNRIRRVEVRHYAASVRRHGDTLGACNPGRARLIIEADEEYRSKSSDHAFLVKIASELGRPAFDIIEEANNIEKAVPIDSARAAVIR